MFANKYLLILVLVLPAQLLAQQARYFPREMLPYENAVCRVKVQCRDGATAYGSGVLIVTPKTHNQKTNFVYTAYHVIDDQVAVSVTFDGETYLDAAVAAARPACDGALLKLLSEPAEATPRIPIATREIEMGEQAFAFGFGDARSNELRCSGGEVVRMNMNSYHDPVFFELAGKTRNGDSGGPILVMRGGEPRLIGNAWGSGYDQEFGYNTVSGTRLSVLNRLFGKEVAPTHKVAPGQSSARIIVNGPSIRDGGSFVVPSSGGS